MKNGYFYVWLFCLAAVKQQLTQMFQHKKYTEANGDNDCFGRNINHRTRSENDHANTLYSWLSRRSRIIWRDDTAFCPKRLGEQ